MKDGRPAFEGFMFGTIAGHVVVASPVHLGLFRRRFWELRILGDGGRVVGVTQSRRDVGVAESAVRDYLALTGESDDGR